MVAFVESSVGIVAALALAAFAFAALLEQVERQRTRQRAETIRRFAPQPLIAPPLLVAVLAGAAAEEGAEPYVGGRRDEFLALGLDELEALDAAAEIEVDDFRSLVGRGCPPRLALEILR
jgi:hypothetical protein